MNLPWLIRFLLLEFVKRPKQVAVGLARQTAVEVMRALARKS